MENRNIIPVITIKPLHDLSTLAADIEYWRALTPQEKMGALDSIRKEYNSWKYPDGTRLQRVVNIVKRGQEKI